MTDEMADQPNEDPNALETVSDVVGDLVTGIPAPIRKNAFKAFGQLCTAAVEYPISLINNAIEEKKAESDARKKIISVSADQIISHMQTDPEYARVAVKKFGQKILRERVNLDTIGLLAAAELKADDTPELKDAGEETKPISDDWINVFEDAGSHISSEQMQRKFAKILAGEIRKPGSFSIKTVRLLSQLDNEPANLFVRLCSMSISLRNPNLGDVIDARVVSMGNAAQNSLQKYGLGFGALNILGEYGLIISDYNSYNNYGVSIIRGNTIGIPVTYQNKSMAILMDDGHQPPEELRVHGVAFTKAGKELLPIIEIQPEPDYTVALINFFNEKKMKLSQITSLNIS